MHSNIIDFQVFDLCCVVFFYSFSLCQILCCLLDSIHAHQAHIRTQNHHVSHSKISDVFQTICFERFFFSSFEFPVTQGATIVVATNTHAYQNIIRQVSKLSAPSLCARRLSNEAQAHNNQHNNEVHSLLSC